MSMLIATRRNIKEVSCKPYMINFKPGCFVQMGAGNWYYHPVGGFGLRDAIPIFNESIPDEIKLLMLIGGYS